MMASIVH